MPPLSTLQLPQRVVRVLERNGIADTVALLSKNERELFSLSGFGGKCLEAVHTALEFAGLELAVDPYASYVCARHGHASWDTNLSNLFLCEDCATKWKRAAFDNQAASYEGAPVTGFCLNCNILRDDVRLRQWLLCGACERVARSIGRSVVAERFVVKTWNNVISHNAPGLAIESTDEPTLRRRNNKPSSPKRAEIDFMIKEATGRNVFGFELKTGKSYISGVAPVGARMSQFQLDTSDCDDIISVMRRENRPVYLLHVQVIDRIYPPTQQYLALEGWWTDVFRMAKHFRHVQRRPRETRNAAYYDTAMFDPIDTFAEYVAHGAYRELEQRLHSQGIPELYRL